MSSLFEYDSLETMPNLETLRIVISNSSLNRLVVKVPRLSKYCGLSDELARARRERQESGNATAEEGMDNDDSDDSQELWTHENWNLRRLKKLELNGFSALVFSFGWLCVCPNLEEMSVLYSMFVFQRLRLYPNEDPNVRAALLSSSSLSSLSLASPLSSSSIKDHPLVHSKLRRNHLDEKWVLHNDDLTVLLKYLAPNLVELSVYKTSDESGVTSRYFLQNGK